VFTPSLQCGGSERFVSLLCNHIRKDRFEVCLAVLNNQQPFYAIDRESVAVVDLHESRVRYSLIGIRKLVKAFQPDIIFSTANHLNLYFALFRNRFPRQVKFIARESSIVSINTQRAPWPALYNWLIKTYYRRFDLLICQGTYMQQDLIKNYRVPAERTVVVYNAVDRKRSPVVASTTGSGKIYTLLTVARLSEEKGVERLIHAVGLLSLPVRFYIVGDGNKKDTLQQLVQELGLGEQIIFLGEKQEPFSGMEDTDLFLVGSYYEGFPNALLEAQALGIPAVAFDVPGGIGEIIRQGENGLMADDNDLIGFAAAIKQALSTSFDRQRIIENTQKRFSLEEMIQKLEGLLAEL